MPNDKPPSALDFLRAEDDDNSNRIDLIEPDIGNLHGKSCWINVGSIAIQIRREGPKVIVTAEPLGQEGRIELGSFTVDLDVAAKLGGLDNV